MELGPEHIDELWQPGITLILVCSRVSEAIRQTADTFHRLISDYHRSMDPVALRRLLLANDGNGRAWTDKEVADAIHAVATQQRRLLSMSLREVAASVLQQQQLLLVHEQRQSGLSPLQRLHQNARDRLLATRLGAAASNGWRHLGSTAATAGVYIGQLPLLRQLLQSPISRLLRNRKTVDISLHYMSPTAFGFADVK